MKARTSIAAAMSMLLFVAACASGDDNNSADKAGTSAAATAPVAGSGAAGTAAGEAPTDGGSSETIDATITWSDLGSGTVNFDPGLSSLNVRNFLFPVYDPLIRRSGDGEFHPSLATSWEYTSPTEFHMTLRDDVKFEDGTPFNGDVVKKNLEYVHTASGPLASQLAAISEVVVNSPTDVTIKLSSPVPSLPAALSSTIGLMVHPDHVGGPELASQPFGTGPYTLDTDSTIANDTYSYVKKADYWQPEHYPYKNAKVKVIADPQAVINALRAGDIQVGLIVDVSQAKTAEEAGLNVQSAPFNIDDLMLFDRAGTKVPALADQRVREALNYAIDRKTIVDTIQLGQGNATTQLLKPGLAGYDQTLDSKYPYDVDKAKALLAEAGYKDGFSMDMVSISLWDPNAQAVAGMLAKIGVKVNIVNVPSNQYIPSIIAGEYPSAYLPFAVSDTFFDLPQLVLPDGGFNPFKSEDSEVVSLWEQAKTATTDDGRNAIYQKLNARIVDLAWFVPVHTRSLSLASSPDITGVEFTQVLPQPFYDVRPKG